MGLTAASTGRQSCCAAGAKHPGCMDGDCRVIALAGNPNVGKSTVFNALTGLHQHTGNWPGKTVGSARGVCRHRGRDYMLVDIPGAYSLTAQSAEEEVARDFLCFGGADAAVVVCDATCLERNMNLVLQILEVTSRVIVCVNLMDEARKKDIHIDLDALSAALGVPCIGASARSGRGLGELMDRAAEMAGAAGALRSHRVRYAEPIERALEPLIGALCAVRSASGCPAFARCCKKQPDARFVAIRLLCGDEAVLAGVDALLEAPLLRQEGVAAALEEARASLLQTGYSTERVRDAVVDAIFQDGAAICAGAVRTGSERHRARQLSIDRVLTGRWTGLPVMLLGLLLVFYLTIAGANLPSALLADALFALQDVLSGLCAAIGMPAWLHGALVFGVYRTLAWVVSVMLPPMAIFFPLFTLLEDLGYLPRVAFNLDNRFRRCAACGKQALTMCMVDNGMRRDRKSRPDRRRGAREIGGDVALVVLSSVLAMKPTNLFLHPSGHRNLPGGKLHAAPHQLHAKRRLLRRGQMLFRRCFSIDSTGQDQL